MTQEEKQLLLQDLCARLPCGVRVKYFDMEYPFGSEPVILTSYLLYNRWENIQDVKPYLRMMSSMTMEEQREYISAGRSMSPDNPSILVDWLNAHHFDYRIDPSTGKTLIESNLAIEAPKDMYKNE